MRDLARQIARLPSAQRDRLERLRADSAPAIPPRASGTPDLSFAQERMWFLEELSPGSAANSIVARFKVEGKEQQHHEVALFNREDGLWVYVGTAKDAGKTSLHLR